MLVICCSAGVGALRDWDTRTIASVSLVAAARPGKKAQGHLEKEEDMMAA
jgi:hypothetical protein